MREPRWSRVAEQFHRLADLPADEQRRELGALAAEDAELACEIASLLAADRAPGLPETAAAALAPAAALSPGTRVGAYRVVEELARGGMGVVYRAERADGAYERQVAIKVVRPDLATAALAERLGAERRILAGLDHPGIVRLLDAGSTPDGRLYLVLELVAGVRLDAWAPGRSLDERLRLFLEVCDAVEHAHQRLVLHRDLKPANVLVTADGRPRLLDFGIARLLAEDAGPGDDTRLGLRPLTPEYASPEQLRGEPLSTASDVWALGVLLYELLAGSRPWGEAADTSPEERARRLATLPVPRPSAALRRAGPRSGVEARAVAGNVDAVVGRALAVEAADRYPTVAALAADLRRHLAGLPVVARPLGPLGRAAAFVRRRRAAVAVVAAFTLVLLAATAFSLRQAAVAAAERDRAERRFAELRELANVFLFELPGRIERLPGATGARELLVATGLEYLDRLAADGGDDPGFRAELAAGYERLGQLQGGFRAPNVGDAAAALATLDRAVAIRRDLWAAPGAPPTAAHTLAEAHRLRASARFKTGDMAAGREDATEAARLLGAADRAPWPPAPPELERARARAVGVRGLIEAATGDLESAEASLRDALASFDALGAATASDPRLRRERAEVLVHLGSVVGQSGEGMPELDRLWTEALAVDRALLAAAPRDREWQRAVRNDLGRLSIARGLQGRLEESLELSGEATEIAARLVAEDPDDVEAQRILSQIASRRSVPLADLGRLDEAEASARRGLAVALQLHARDPSDVTLEVLVGEGRQAVGQALLARARAGGDVALWRAARAELVAALSLIDDLVERGVLDPALGEARERVELQHRVEQCDAVLAGELSAAVGDGP